jgi:hypothetical protein
MPIRERMIRFSLFESEVERLKEFPGGLEKTILDAVKLFIEDQKQARLMSIQGNLYSHGNLQSVYAPIPASLAQALNVCTQRPEEAVSWFLASYRPPTAAEKGKTS